MLASDGPHERLTGREAQGFHFLCEARQSGELWRKTWVVKDRECVNVVVEIVLVLMEAW